MKYAIETHHVGKTYRNGVEALKDVSIQVECGEIFCLLGQNGAGKSTFIHILSTFFEPTKGEIKLFSEAVTSKNVHSLRRKIATVSQQISIDTYLSLKDNMLFQAELYGVSKEQAIQRMNELIEGFQLEKYLNYPVSSFSGGIKRRLDIALNLMSNPQLLFLDEPTVGMDIQSRREMWKMIRHIKEKMKTTIFLTTHYLEEAEQLSDTICIMKDGKILVQETTAKIRDYFHENMMAFKFSTAKEAKEKYSLFRSGLTNYYRTISLKGEFIIIYQYDEFDLNFFLQWIIDNNISLIGVSLVYPTLEDIFVRIVGKENKS
ncbi:TPA: ABC transporter ATP-binding protein [Enterococcus faecium]